MQVIATIAAACAGFAAGWVCRTALPRRQPYWLDYCRRRGSNPPPPGRKPAPPAGPPEQPLTAQLIRYWRWQDEQVRQALEEDTTTRRPGPYSNHPQGFPPPPPKVGCTRWFINDPATIAECGGSCAVGPRHCDCGALWVDVPTTNPSEAP